METQIQTLITRYENLIDVYKNFFSPYNIDIDSLKTYDEKIGFVAYAGFSIAKDLIRKIASDIEGIIRKHIEKCTECGKNVTVICDDGGYKILQCDCKR